MTLSEYLLLFVGTEYKWGGNTPEQGFDCSGLVCEGLRAQGILGKEDLSAQGIYNRLVENEFGTSRSMPFKDCLLFYGKSTDKITHIAVAINPKQIIEAGGEGRVETDQGFVRVRAVGHRKDLVAILDL